MCQVVRGLPEPRPPLPATCLFWFGVILVMFIELGQISPPIGINLFVIQSIWDGKLSEVVLGTIPFHLLMFVLLFLLALWPDLALWLPAHMVQG